MTPLQTHAAGRLRSAIPAVLSAMVIVLGLATLLGWHADSPQMTNWVTGKTRMVYNTAVSFVILGAALLASIRGRRRTSVWLAGLGGLVSLLTLFEYVAGVSIGIDEVMVRVGDASQFPGRVAPNTAVCLLLLSVSVAGLRRVGRLRFRTLGSPLLASVALGLSVISLAGYVTGFSTSGWGRFIPMAIPTSVGLLLLSLGVLSSCWLKSEIHNGAAPPWLYLGISVAAIVMTISLWQALAAEERVRISRDIAGQLEIVRASLVADMEFRIGAVTRFVRRWEHSGLPDTAQRDFETGLLVKDVRGFEAIGWVDPSLHVSWVYPPERRGALLGADLGSDPIRRAALESARATRGAAVTRPLRLLAGGDGINVYVPIYGAAELQGFIIVGFRFQDLFRQVLNPTLAPGYAIAVSDGSQQIYLYADVDDATDRRWVQRASAAFGNTRWQLELWPTRSGLAASQSIASNTVLMAGILLSLLLGASVFLAQTSRERTRLVERARAELEGEVAERRRAEQELDQFFTLAPDMLCIAGFDGYFKRINTAWERVLGIPRERLLSEPFATHIHPDDRSATQNVVRDQEGGQSIFAFENRYRAQDGSYRWFRWNSLPAPERNLIFAAARDVTSEKAADEALHRAADELEQRVCERTRELESANQALHASEELFRRLFAESPIGTAMVGLDQRLTLVNQALCGLLGYDARELLHLSLRDITDPEEPPAESALVAETIRAGNPGRRLTKRFVKKTGEIVWGEVTTTALRDAGGCPISILVMIEDVTERRRHDEQVSRLNRELGMRVGELTAVNQELESFNYSISHDLRAPLRHIDGFSKILLEEHAAQMSDAARRYVDVVCAAARRMGRMVDALLELSRTSRKELTRRRTSLRPLVEDVVEDMMTGLAGRRIEWLIGALPDLDCDPILTRQVFANLLSNSAKFSRPRSPAVIEISCTTYQGVPSLFVRDNGVGFSMTYSGKLFGAFQRFHRAEEFEGTGIGLATVWRIVQKHGGRIWAEAELDRGATFYFTLVPAEVLLEKEGEGLMAMKM
jgi:PAS domain S-box-containing protein